MTKMPLPVGLIGLGAIGQAIVHLVRQHAVAEVDVVAALVRDVTLRLRVLPTAEGLEATGAD